MKICLTTLGCPSWDLDTVCRKGEEYGFDGIDFRGLLDDLDITLLPAFTTGVTETKRKIQDKGLEVSGIASSIKVCVPEAQEENFEEAKRTITVARELGCQNIRVFGQGDLKKFSKQELAKIGLDCVEAILALDGAEEMRWLFETHDNWIKAHDCKLLLDNIANPAFGALWDMGHTSRVGGESPQESYTAMRGRVGHTHVKDAVYDPTHERAMEDGWYYVLPGEGQLPLTEAIALLKQEGYDGWMMFEHEKRWHPDLLEPEVAFPAFVKWIRPLIA
ncbi:xylose isomerase [candidate division KSB3 bacterium]|uniref:Xylose isomerase n=1 Tax=candidate division KSB3 bacterium TaxID=2044937 RepID=A0A2G6KJV2_9BACT|nr:MAG: xylose isomerase [candidate division KSB3 bacterium]